MKKNKSGKTVNRKEHLFCLWPEKYKYHGQFVKAAIENLKAFDPARDWPVCEIRIVKDLQCLSVSEICENTIVEDNEKTEFFESDLPELSEVVSKLRKQLEIIKKYQSVEGKCLRVGDWDEPSDNEDEFKHIISSRQKQAVWIEKPNWRPKINLFKCSVVAFLIVNAFVLYHKR